MAVAALSFLAVDDRPDDTRDGNGTSSQTFLARAIEASLFLHGVIFTGLMGVNFLSRQSGSVPESPLGQTITITLVSNDNVSVMPEAGKAGQVSLDTQITDQSAGEQSPRLPVAPQSRPPEAVSVDEATSPAPAATPNLAGLDRKSTMALVSEGIADFIETWHSNTTREYVEGCIRYRNRYGPNSDCPEVFPGDYRRNEPGRQLAEEVFAMVTRDADQARMRYKLERENELLQEMMEAGGTSDEQAEIRWQLNRQYHAYLSGNILPALTFLEQTAFVNDYSRTITPAPVQFGCRDNPCVYRYTGFAVKQPENTVEMVPSFTEQTPLFMPSQD